jgi:hypothetical protein
MGSELARVLDADLQPPDASELTMQGRPGLGDQRHSTKRR